MTTTIGLFRPKLYTLRVLKRILTICYIAIYRQSMEVHGRGPLVQQCFLLMRNDFKFLKQVESKTNQFEIVFKSLARFSTQSRVKESFKLF